MDGREGDNILWLMYMCLQHLQQFGHTQTQTHKHKHTEHRPHTYIRTHTHTHHALNTHCTLTHTTHTITSVQNRQHHDIRRHVPSAKPGLAPVVVGDSHSQDQPSLPEGPVASVHRVRGDVQTLHASRLQEFLE